MLKKCDGTPYRLAGNLSQFDPENREHDLFNLWDEEAIELGGTPIWYYAAFSTHNTIDPLYREDRGKVWSTVPIQLFCYYDPVPGQNYMNMFGLDSPDETQFDLNYRAVLKKLGHPPKLGSRLFTPHRREHWVIVQRNLGEFKMWGELRLSLMCQRFQESVTTNEGKVTQAQPDFKLNSGSLLR
jgi:hypothetical protein